MLSFIAINQISNPNRRRRSVSESDVIFKKHVEFVDQKKYKNTAKNDENDSNNVSTNDKLDQSKTINTDDEKQKQAEIADKQNAGSNEGL